MFKRIIAFIRELYNQPEANIPLHAPVFNGNEKKYLNECIDTTYVSSVGDFVNRFEQEIAEYTGASKAVACVNGTNALHLALKMVGVEFDTEVITQPLTFIATVNAITYCGGYPIFLDVDRETLGLSSEALLEFLETLTMQKADGCFNIMTKRRISACVPMHTFGHPCRIEEVMKICNQYHIPVIEDAAESLGSFYSPLEIIKENVKGEIETAISRAKGQHTGTFGEIGVLSFNGNKILTTGGGGMLLFKDEELGKRAKHLTTQAKIPHPWEFVHDEMGYNYRMPNINAALGLAQLEQLNTFLRSKRKIAYAYCQFFKGTDIKFVKEPNHAISNYWLNCIIFRNKEKRNSFLKYSNENGVMTRPAWELMNHLFMFKDMQCGDLTNAEWIAERLVNLPSSVIQ